MSERLSRMNELNNVLPSDFDSGIPGVGSVIELNTDSIIGNSVYARKRINRRDFLILAAGGFLTACTPKPVVDALAAATKAATATEAPPATATATEAPPATATATEAPPATATATEAATATATPDVKKIAKENNIYPETAGNEYTYTMVNENDTDYIQVSIIKTVAGKKTEVPRGRYAKKSAVNQEWVTLDRTNPDHWEDMFGFLVPEDIEYINPETDTVGTVAVFGNFKNRQVKAIWLDEEEVDTSTRGETQKITYFLMGTRTPAGDLHIFRFGADYADMIPFSPQENPHVHDVECSRGDGNTKSVFQSIDGPLSATYDYLYENRPFTATMEITLPLSPISGESKLMPNRYYLWPLVRQSFVDGTGVTPDEGQQIAQEDWDGTLPKRLFTIFNVRDWIQLPLCQ